MDTATQSSGNRSPGSFSDPPHTLNAGLWFRRGRLAMVFSSLAASCCCCAENPLIPAVQISAAISEEGAVVPFDWAVEGGAVGFDLHGDGSGNEFSYEKGRAVPGAASRLTAAFSGNHGWFWRNCGHPIPCCASDPRRRLAECGSQVRAQALWRAYGKIWAREVTKDIIVGQRGDVNQGTRQVSMRPSAMSFLSETRGTAKPGPATALWFGFARLVSCFIVALVLSLFVAPGEAQAHGMHGSLGVTVSTEGTEGSAQADALGGSEVSASNCVICCAASGCVAVSFFGTLNLFDAGGPKSAFQAAATVAVSQMTLYGLRRPPRQTS